MKQVFARFIITISAAAGLMLLAGLAAPGARATPFFTQQTGLRCVSCHNAGQEADGVAGLNAFGITFKQCGYHVGCAVPPPPPPVALTTQSHDGLAVFKNVCAPGQQLFLALRPGKNSAKRDIVIILDPGDHVKMGLQAGSTLATACDHIPSDSDDFRWVNLVKASN